jgi:hypothetical protein
MVALKRLARDPFRFDAFDLLATLAQRQKITINTKEATEQLVERLRISLEEALGSDTFMYGQHTQALFEALTVSLGAVKLLKREDAGDLYADEDLEIPDYRVVLPDGRQMLVEVKNRYQKEPFADPLTLANDYFVGMLRYAELMKCPLRFAVFWARWNIWTLVAPTVFKSRSVDYELTVRDALMNNDMAILGDKAIGVAFPLKMRFVADPTMPRTVESDGSVTMRISGVKLFCKDKEITDPLDKNVAWYLMLYGRWGPARPARVEILNGVVEYLEEEFMPAEDSGQGFEIVGWLSGMYSTFYQERTAPEGRIGQVRLDAVPGKLADLIPEGYHGKTMPLWICILAPSHPL